MNPAPAKVTAAETPRASGLLHVAYIVMAALVGLCVGVFVAVGLGIVAAGLAVFGWIGCAWYACRQGKALWWVVGAGFGAVVLVILYLISALSEQRQISRAKSVRTSQLIAAVDQYFVENPERIFVRYDELVGPTNYVKSTLPIHGEDYRTLFPWRRDEVVLPVTFQDGWQVILHEGRRILRSPRGKMTSLSGAESLAAYERWLATEQGRDGLHVQILELPPEPKATRFETTYRKGVRDGPFRAYYADGRLWAEATYKDGRLVGLHRVYEASGKVVHETNFAP